MSSKSDTIFTGGYNVTKHVPSEFDKQCTKVIDAIGGFGDTPEEVSNRIGLLEQCIDYLRMALEDRLGNT